MSLTSRLQVLLNYANEKTGASDTTLGNAVKTLSDGYGFKGFKYGGTNAQLVASYDESWTLADTSFVIGSSASTSSTSIKATISNRFTTATVTVGDKDVVVVQTAYAKPTHSSSAANKALMLMNCTCHINHASKRKTTDTSAYTYRQVNSMVGNMAKYYNTSGVLTRGAVNYGFYCSPQTPTFSSATSANTTIRIGSPILYYRASSSYETTTNIKLVTECDFVWHVDVYLVDSGSSLTRTLNDKLDSLLIEEG